MKITWGYDIKEVHFVIFVDNKCYYADEIILDGVSQSRGEGESEVNAWEIEEKMSVDCCNPHKIVIFRAKTSTKKPALGVIPCYIAAEKRIADLADGIKRQLTEEKPNYDLIKRWADEIGNQCDVVEYDRAWNE